MTKFAVAVLIIVALLGGGYLFYSSQQTVKTPAVSQNPPVSKLSTNTPSPTVPPTNSVADTSDASIDNDLTALDKDLSAVDDSETSFLNELNSL